MRPKQRATTGESDLFRARLDQIINLKHELVQLAGKIDWAWIDDEIAPLYSDKGRPGIETRFVKTVTDMQRGFDNIPGYPAPPVRGQERR